MVQIEILAKEGPVITAVFNYYLTVGQQLATAADPTREVIGTKLTDPEKQDVKDGKIWQVYVRTGVDPALTVGQIGTYLVSRYTADGPAALADYTNKFKWVGKYYNGSSWV